MRVKKKKKKNSSALNACGNSFIYIPSVGQCCAVITTASILEI